MNGISKRVPWVLAGVFAASMAWAQQDIAPAHHACDALGDAGWSVVPTLETIAMADGVPYQNGGAWFVDRTVTLLPMCSYYNTHGVYSLRSYSLAPETTTQRIAICRDSVALAPYAGACPPR